MSAADALSKYTTRISEEEYKSSRTIGLFVAYIDLQGGTVKFDIEESKPDSAATASLLRKYLERGLRPSESHALTYANESYKPEVMYAGARRVLSQAKIDQGYDDSLQHPMKAYVVTKEEGQTVYVDISEYPDTEETG